MDEPQAATIAQLRQSGAFRELARVLEDAETRYWEKLTKRLRAGEDPDQSEINHMRAKFEAARQIMAQPDRAARFLERHKEDEPVEV